MSKVFYITTPIYYVSGRPHLGSAYTTIAADVLARYRRLHGDQTVFVTGTDEHGAKVAREAEQANMPTGEFVEKMADSYIKLWERLHIRYDRFIRTSEQEHFDVVQNVFSTLHEQGDIYLGQYEGWYCVPCETHFLESELAEGNICPDCQRAVERRAEPAYFLRTSAYADRLVRHIEENPNFILPESRRNEVLSFIKQGLQDTCISRSRSEWDVPVPGDESQSIYVWIDALINYLTAAGYGTDALKFGSLWPPDVQLMGKDILPRFHATIWPTLLMALDLPLPQMLFGHGWWLAGGGEKMSKSKGNFIDPYEVAGELVKFSGARTAVAVDALRYFVLREVPFGLDGSFSMMGLLGRFNADLANDLGNLLNRTLPLVERYLEGVVPEPGPGAGGLSETIESVRGEYEQCMDLADFCNALKAVWELLAAGNKYLDSREPWTLYKDGKQVELEAVLYDVLDCLRVTAVMIAPFMPVVADEICKQLGLDPETALDWRFVEARRLPAQTRVVRDQPIFPRVDMERAEQKLKPAQESKTPEKPKQVEKQTSKPAEGEKAGDNTISYEEFSKLDLRVGRILSVEKVEDADKLLKLSVDIGEEQPRQVVAGIAQEFAADELVDLLVVVVANLAPAKIRGVESRGMILAPGEKKPLALLTVNRECPIGSKVR